jgi:TPR repeat protein
MDRAAVHYRRKEFEEAVNLWTEVLSVEPSNASAAINLGSSYSDGQGVPRDLARGMELFEEARRGGDTKAAFSLGVLL